MSMLPIQQIIGNQPGPRLLVIAGVHGDEYEPIAAAAQLLDRIKASDLSGTLTIVPVANASAFARNTRCGDDGLDLARTCPGNATGTTTQRVAAELSEHIRQATHLIDLHTGGVAYRISPLCGYLLHPATDVLDQQRAMARGFGLPLVWGTSPALEGRTLSVARDAIVPAIYVEVGGGSTIDPSAVATMSDGCVRVMQLLGMLAGQPPRLFQRVYEDDCDGSGHLQVQNPAPGDGLFISQVKLGDRVAIGTRLGAVHDVQTREVVDALADSDGIVIMLRELPSVRRGDALAAIVAFGDRS